MLTTQLSCFVLVSSVDHCLFTSGTSLATSSSWDNFDCKQLAFITKYQPASKHLDFGVNHFQINFHVLYAICFCIRNPFE